MQIAQPDPTGGYGSFPQQLLGIITGGLQTVAVGKGIEKYGFAFGADGRRYSNVNDGIVEASSPASAPNVAQQAAQMLGNPWVLVAGLGLVVVVVLLVRR